MPLAVEDQLRVDEAENQAKANSTRLLIHDPTDSQKLGPFTIICTILNRMIGSGIFVSPAIVLRGTGSVGASILLWVLGAVAGISGLLVWLELGLSIPKFQPPDAANEPRREGEIPYICVPRNGGEKNYLEYIFENPRFRTTCMFGIVFVILGNRAGNAIAFGIYVMKAAGQPDSPDSPATIRGLAIAAATSACLVHYLWRRGGILLINVFAVMKVMILVAIIALGFAASAGASFGHGNVRGTTIINPQTNQTTSNFNPSIIFRNARDDASSYANSIIFIIYSYGGFEQPFYVLSEVTRPKKIFAKSTIAGIALIAVLFTLVNVAYLCVVSNDATLGKELDMATLFFNKLFANKTAPRVMSGIIALSIYGNIVVTSFTLSRVKQEIAKEGILPFSLFFAKSSVTPYAWIKQRFWPSNLPEATRPRSEETPAAALLLHWIFTMILIGCTAANKPIVAYSVLVALYSYTLVIIVGLFVAGGLLYLRFTNRDDWTTSSGFKPWGGPTAAIIYCLICAFAFIGAWLPPSKGSPFHASTTQHQWYIVPTVGVGVWLIGYVYYFGFAIVLPRMKHKVRVVERDPIIVRQFGRPDGEWVQAVELVEFSWAARGQPPPAEIRGGQYHEVGRALSP